MTNINSRHSPPEYREQHMNSLREFAEERVERLRRADPDTVRYVLDHRGGNTIANNDLIHQSRIRQTALGRPDTPIPKLRRAHPDVVGYAFDHRGGNTLANNDRIHQSRIRETLKYDLESEDLPDSLTYNYVDRTGKDRMWMQRNRFTVLPVARRYSPRDISLAPYRENRVHRAQESRLRNIATRTVETDDALRHLPEGTFVTIPHNVAGGIPYEFTRYSGEYFARNQQGQYYKLVGVRSVRVAEPSWVERTA